VHEEYQQIRWGPAVGYQDSQTQKERLREVNLFSLEKRKVKGGGLIGVFY